MSPYVQKAEVAES